MTAAAPAVGTWSGEDARWRRLFAGPSEGWLTLAGVALMIVALGWSIDDAAWVRGVGSLTDFLPLVGLAGVAVGFIGPKLGWGRWTTHLIGIAFAAVVLPIIAGGIVLGETVPGLGPVALATRYRESAQVIYRVWVDLAIDGRPLTNEYGHYFIAIGALMWATGQFASYAVFGHRRALDAAIVTGLVLLGNMALTQNDQLHLMVLFTLAALTLLARSHAFDERVTWLRRRIGDPAAVTGLYLRGGAVFISAAVLGSLLLTATASSAPLQGLWRQLPGNLVQVSQWFQRYLPLGGASRNPGVVAFGENSAVTGVWSSNDEVAFRARLASTETAKFYWRVGTYAQFEFTAWSWGKTRSTDRDAREDLLTGTADDPLALPGRREVRVEITPETFSSNLVVSPQTLRWVDQPTTLLTTGSRDWFAAVQFGGATSYTVDAVVPIFGDEPGGITANRLRVASRSYDSEIQRIYLDVPKGSIGVEAQKILQTVLSQADNNPYDIAKTMESYLKDAANFRYDTDVRDEAQERCQGVSTVECFARIRAGYCQYYASTMAILLREAGIPTRLAQGFLPGQRGGDGTEVVRNSSAHAWVEVYFPGYGWVDFDPTGGSVSQLAPIASGPPETATPRPSLNLVTDRPGFSEGTGPDRRSRPPGETPGSTAGPSGPAAGPFIVVGLALLLFAAGLVYLAWRRGPRPLHPDRAWGSIGRWAARLGFGQRPSQTVYEYAGALGDVLPLARTELSTVAHAKVEIAYGHRDLGEDRLKAVAEATRRLRVRLLRLALRPRRPHRRRRPR